MGRPQEGSVRSLQELYTVAIGIALAFAMQQVVPDRGEIHQDLLPVAGALLATLIPFYHGAMRHLEATYVERRAAGLRRGALLADFLLLFIEACLVLLAARAIPQPINAAWILVVLLAFDAAWGLTAHWLFVEKGHGWAELRWVWLNAVTAPVMATAIVLLEARAAGSIAFALLGITVARSAIDYWVSWSFYFPEDAG